MKMCSDNSARMIGIGRKWGHRLEKDIGSVYGIGAYFINVADYSTAAGTFLALCGSFMVSYARARAESLGFDAKLGVMQRPERIVLIGLGALTHIMALKITIWLVALLSNFTALQRIRCAYKLDLARRKNDIALKT